MSWPINRWFVPASGGKVDRAPIARTIPGLAMVFAGEPGRIAAAMRDACPRRLPSCSKGARQAMNCLIRVQQPVAA